MPRKKLVKKVEKKAPKTVEPLTPNVITGEVKGLGSQIAVVTE